MIRLIVVIISIGFLTGCAHVISKDVLGVVSKDFTFADLRRSPDDHKGKVVLLGGVIVKTLNKEDGTLLEVYQTEIESDGRPINIDLSGGRFLALYEGFLDGEIYRTGRRLTIAGTVLGKKVRKLGEVDYHYPYLLIKEMHLWEEEKMYRHEPYPWGFWGPWWGYPWHPLYDPYWWRYPNYFYY